MQLLKAVAINSITMYTCTMGVLIQLYIYVNLMMRLLIWARLRVNFACTSLGILVDYSLVKVTSCRILWVYCSWKVLAYMRQEGFIA